MTIANLAVGEEAEHDAAHDYHRNTIAGFIGITGEDRRERAFTLGLEYERRISKTFGVVLSLERAMGDLDFTVLTVPFAWHRGPWTFSAGPGIEFPDHEGENEFVVRGSVLYTFERSGYELAPKFAVDFVDGEVVLIGGLVVGFGF
jgi:hypothetical protein